MYPNQKRITVNKEKSDAYNRYAVYNLYSLNHAMVDLSKGSAFKLWVYLAHNQDNYTFDLSCAELAKWGLKPDAYHVAVKELINKGYLRLIAENYYNFYELPEVVYGEKP